MEQEIKFILERYRSGGSNRYTCPNCGRKKCFTRYIDIETGRYIADECGKCNHESRCGYHYPPRDYFRDHPGQSQTSSLQPFLVNGIPMVLSKTRKTAVKVPTEVHQTEFYNMAWAEAAARRTSPFRTWFESLPFDAQRISQVLAEYYVGATATDIVVNGRNYGPAAVFWMIDEQGRAHDAKFIAYTPDGHRVEGWGNSMRSVCEKTKTGPQLQETEKVLFGLHLVPHYPDRPVCIVESEKTALICACHYPEYVWLATGGCGNLQPSKLRPLTGRHVVIYPDSGEYDRWKTCMEKSQHKDYAIVDFMEQYPPNTDIADVLLDAEKPQTEAQKLMKQMAADNPVFAHFCTALDLEPDE